ncbi:hypothetical protein PMAYCL1PPCAC_23671 [Pristionchus mayeri]|uniref:Mon2/Sec7/BIG1-like HDS domain-containing protein n=1 Tax=Pristionchus mayeri TaxID=1317129 RepID=A0AAN5I7S7_9BILA|nr:hypothetical protein PMAYCL1PPCAC_23671 [Pristionchus mayeri]
MSSRAAISQSISSYCSNRYAAVVDEVQDNIAVYLDATSILEGYVGLLDQMKTTNEQSVVVLDATHALLSSQPLSVLSHTPFLNLLWEKLCPLLIKLLGVPDKISSTPTPVSTSASDSTDEPVGQGQMARFTLSPAVLASPEASRALYLIVDQLLRLLCAVSSMHSVLEALFHKAFLFPKIEQRTEAIKVIRKLLGDPRRLADLVRVSLSARSLSLWRMLIVCLVESSSPQFDVCIESIRATQSMLEGLLEFIESDSFLPSESKETLLALFPTLEEATAESFANPIRRMTTMESRDSVETTGGNEADEEGEEDYSDTLRRLEKKFGIVKEEEEGEEGEEGKRSLRGSIDDEPPPTPSSDPISEKATARRFVTCLSQRIQDWEKLRSTVQVDAAIIDFASGYYQEFSLAHSENFRTKSKVQQEFLNTDALYLTALSCLSLGFRGAHRVSWGLFKSKVLVPGCLVYASETWLSEVYLSAMNNEEVRVKEEGALTDLIRDYDGFDNRKLSDFDRLERIREGPGDSAKSLPERLAARWFITASWEGISKILSTFVSVKERKKTRPKVQEAVVYAIRATQKLANLALALGLGSRCGWIFERLVESSCDVDELRKTASAEEAKRINLVDRDDLLSIQLVLDNAFVAIHAPECWKQVIRCTEYVWELEKYIYGALCYQEKSSRSLLGSWRKENAREKAREDWEPAVEKDVESVVREGRESVTKDEINKAICILIAKTDRLYSSVGSCLSLPSLHSFLHSLILSSENRLLLTSTKSPSLTPPDSLLARLSLILSHFTGRPLVHQMLLWATVAAHLIQIASSSVDESRTAGNVLSEAVASLVISESAGQSFNQMILAPFQTIMCREECQPETRTQLILALAESVKERSDRLGSGWKPLFGALKAVRSLQLEEDRVPWTVLDVIATYLRLTKCSVLSSSLPDCLACVSHFLQSSLLHGSILPSKQKDEENKTESGEEEKKSPIDLDTQVSEATLNLIRPLFTVILNLYRTPHIPNQSLLHRLELRTRALSAPKEFDSLHLSQSVPPLSTLLDPLTSTRLPQDPPSSTLDRPLEVPVGDLPWMNNPDAQAHEMASCELVLSLVEQLCGALITAPSTVQPTMIETIEYLITTVRTSECGPSVAAYCVHSLLLPHITAWTKRVGGKKSSDRGGTTNHKHAVGTATAIVVDSIALSPEGTWETRLLADMLEVARVCLEQPGDLSRVGVASIRHLITLAPSFTQSQWRVVTKSLWDAWAVTLLPLRKLLCHYLEGGGESSEGGEIFTDGKSCLSGRARMLAKQVFLVDEQREELNGEDDSEEGEKSEEGATVIVVREGLRETIGVGDLVRSLLAHQMLIQQVALLLSSAHSVPDGLRKIIPTVTEGYLERLSDDSRWTLFQCLDASIQTSLDLDSRPSLSSLLSRLLSVPNANLHKQKVSATAIKMHSLFSLAEMDESEESPHLWRIARMEEYLVRELDRVEKETAREKISAYARQHREQKFEFMLVEEDGEKLYSLVGEKQISSTLSEYKNHRPVGVPSARVNGNRQNPFTSTTDENGRKGLNERLNPSSLRLGSLRDSSLIIIDRLISSPHFGRYLPYLLPSIKSCVRASPDLEIRQKFISLVDKIVEK